MRTKKTIIYLLIMFALLLQACGGAGANNGGNNATNNNMADNTANNGGQDMADSGDGETLHIRVQLLPFLSYLPVYIADQKGYFADENLEVEFFPLRGAEGLVAVLNGDLDVVSPIVSAGFFTSVLENQNVRIVANLGYLEPNGWNDGCFDRAFLIRSEDAASGRFDDLNALAGINIEVTDAGLDGYAFEQIIADTGLTYDDMILHDLSPPSTENEALTNGAIDVGSQSEPWVTRATASGDIVVWKGFAEGAPDLDYSVMVFGGEVLGENRAAGQAYLKAYMRAVEDMRAGPTDENVALASAFTEIDEDILRNLCWALPREGGVINVNGLIAFQEWAVARGYLESVVPGDMFYDPSFLENLNQ